MHISRKPIAFSVVFAATISLLASEAYSCIRCGAPNPGKGCRQLVTVKHPDLKGADRKKEWDKCMSNPDSYGK